MASGEGGLNPKARGARVVRLPGTGVVPQVTPRYEHGVQRMPASNALEEGAGRLKARIVRLPDAGEEAAGNVFPQVSHRYGH